MILLPTSYFPPISYISAIARASSWQLEIHEHFVRQTYKNRCTIYGANGRLNLVVPVRRRRSRIPVKDVLIDNEHPWKKIHWKSITSAYRRSPWFEFFEDDFALIFEKEYKYLTDLNEAALSPVLDFLKLSLPSPPTVEYFKDPEGVTDLRNIFTMSPGHHNTNPPTYTQVFGHINGFQPNLSILDLIFNEGKTSVSYLR